MTILRYALPLVAGALASAGAQRYERATTTPGTLSTVADRQLGLAVPSAAQRRAAFAAADPVLALLRADGALAKPIGYTVALRRVAGITRLTPDDRPIDGTLHYGVTGTLSYLVTGDDGHGGRETTAEGGLVGFDVVVNSIGRLTDAEEWTAMIDTGPSVISSLRQTGEFRGHPIYDGECAVVTSRPVAPFVPLTRERYYKLLILYIRADSAKNAAAQARDRAAQSGGADGGAAGAAAERARRAADTKAAYEMMKKLDPKAAEDFLTQSKQLEAQLQAAASADTGAGSMANKMAVIEQQGAVEVGRHLHELQDKLDALSPSDRRAPVAVQLHHYLWDWRSDALADINDPDASPLVQVNPDFFDRARPATAPQIVTVCMPGLQGLENKSYERLAGAEREDERQMLEQRTRDAVRIRDQLDWAALEALVKP